MTTITEREMTQTAESIAAEIRRLRKGRGLNSPALSQLLGPGLRELAETADGDPGRRRRVLATELTTFASKLADDLKAAILASLAISADTRLMPRLQDRVGWLAAQLNVDYRTALRRVDHAERLMGEEIAVELGQRQSRAAFAPHGWYLDELRTLLRLDTGTPESHEQRRIIATRDGLEEVAIGLDIPTEPGQPSPSLSVEILYGGRLVRREQPGRNRFRLLIHLPKPLAFGASHEYGLILRLPEGQPMRPHYVFTPECVCKTFTLRVRFDLNRLPAWVRRVDGETVRTFDDARLGNDALTIDDAGEIYQQFHNPAMYLGYGAQWLP